MAAIANTAALQVKQLTAEKITRIVKTIADNCNPERIILFGSYADGDPRLGSDLDLLVVMESSLPRHRRSVPIQLLFRPMPCAMDILVYTPDEVRKWGTVVNHILSEALRSGKVLYERPN